MIYVLVGVGYLIDILFITHDIKKHDGLSIVLKTLASACFVLLGIMLSFDAVEKGLANFMILALFADLLGDFVLILRNVLPKYHDLLYVIGTAFFFVGHIFLMIMLYANYSNVILKSLLFAIVMFGVAYFFLFKKLEMSKAFKIVGAIYFFFIIYIQAYSLCSYIDIKDHFNLAFLFGYFLFAVSDIILVAHKFKKGASESLQPIYRLSYFISQILIALSIAFL